LQLQNSCHKCHGLKNLILFAVLLGITFMKVRGRGREEGDKEWGGIKREGAGASRAFFKSYLPPLTSLLSLSLFSSPLSLPLSLLRSVDA
jgi:hypothetical protein